MKRLSERRNRDDPQQRRIAKLNEQELEAGVSEAGSWHNDYKDTAFVFIGSLPFNLTEGDILAIFSQYGNPVFIDLMRDKDTGKSKGFAFLKYEDQRSTVLAVDNLDGATVLGRTIRVDHTFYKTKGDEEELQQAMSFDKPEGERKERYGSLLATLALLISSASAFETHNELYACMMATEYVEPTMGLWNYTGEIRCSSTTWLAAFMECMHTFAPSKLTPYFYSGWATTCAEYTWVIEPEKEVQEELEGIYKNATETGWYIELDSVKNTTDRPVTPDKEIYEAALRYNRASYSEIGKGTYFSEAMIGYWSLVFLLAMVVHGLQLFYSRAYVSYKLNKLRQLVFVPATFGRRHNVVVRFLGYIPTRAQTIVIAIHCLMNFLFLCFGYEIVYPNVYYIDRKTLQIDYLSHRSGIMAFGQLPLVFLFASRNNFLMWLTGWSFNTFNVYHRWVARTMFLNAAIHSVCWTIYAVRADALHTYYVKPYWLCGVVALCISCLMLLQGWYVLRRAAYQIFLAVHIVFTVVFILGSWFHVDFFHGGFGYTAWLKVSIGFWVFDRVCRICRMIGLGWTRPSTVEVRGKDVCRVEIGCSKAMRVYPGAHVYIYVMVWGGFWQSHPFSVFRSNVMNEEHKIVILARRNNGITQKLFRRAMAAAAGGGGGDQADVVGGREDSVKVKSIGGEDTIVRDCIGERDGSERGQLKTIVEGPYGHYQPTLLEYDTVLLIAGGVGITAVFQWAVELGRRTVAEEEESAEKDERRRRRRRRGKEGRRRTILRWYIRERDALEWLPKEMETLVRGGGVEVQIYVTGGSDGIEMAEGEEVRRLVEAVRVEHGRPSVEGFVEEAVAGSYEGGSVGVMVSGPGQMNDAVRASVVGCMGKAKGRVEYFDETFGW
ncbi:hypothetical protein BZA70DRAFT_289967 [Myxozyma melibiosi]|uniref:RRM domain-containing protein n=1 Tax=Myxozyma melibiosi TaxID=54550 RepID=A0ABR1F698_9ASCO